jgi:hypothetical protein
MKAINQKHEILESLDALDHAQAEQVLSYIKGLLSKGGDNETQHHTVKREAMKQIRQALGNTRATVNPGF